MIGSWDSKRNRFFSTGEDAGGIVGGPLGKLPILDTYEQSEKEWPLAGRKPDFFVVDVR